jgi:hypothetical protein
VGKIGTPGADLGKPLVRPAEHVAEGATSVSNAPATPPRSTPPVGMPTGRPPAIGGSRPPLPRVKAFLGRQNAPPGFLRGSAQTAAPITASPEPYLQDPPTPQSSSLSLDKPDHPTIAMQPMLSPHSGARQDLPNPFALANAPAGLQRIGQKPTTSSVMGSAQHSTAQHSTAQLSSKIGSQPQIGQLKAQTVLGRQPAMHNQSVAATHLRPTNAAAYPPAPMLKKYAGEENGSVFGTSVKYLGATERQAYKVTIKNGLMMDANGKPLDTKDASSAFGPGFGRAIFVMDKDGTLYASNEQTEGKFHHSSFLAGAPVAAAGEIRVENGVMKEVSRRSGHYCPSKEQLDNFLSEIKKQGAPPVAVDEPKNVFTYIEDV